MQRIVIGLPDALAARVARAASQLDVTPHRFMLEAILEHVARSERRADVEALVADRRARLAESGRTVPCEDVLQGLEDTLALHARAARAKAD